MGCGCGGRANRFLHWLGFHYENLNRWQLLGRRGFVALHMDVEQHHFRLSVLALVARLVVGKEA